jgi:uncharacterized protein DUF2019
MTPGAMSDASVQQLVSRYAEAAGAHMQATEEGDHEAANQQHEVLAEAYRELRRREERRALIPLLVNENLGVRSWAGAHALEFAPQQGARVLEELSATPGVAGFDAQMTLAAWRDGSLSFP